MPRPRSPSARRAAEGPAAQPDPRAPLDRVAFLARATALVRELEADLLARAADDGVRPRLAAAHAAEVKAERTGEGFEPWLRGFVTQAAVAWVLSAVFVRVLEDRGLLPQARLAGPGAMDAQKAFFEIAPSLTERDFLRLTFRELELVPATVALFDAEHSPIHALAPSAEGAKALLRAFREPSAEAPAYRFGHCDTRFLGDLYQDLSESVREKYALLQTPDFVERYILRRTLDRAIERFGLDAATIIDPTCGSGHFLLGAFARLVDERGRREPNTPPSEIARRALDQIAGSDINPYAVAIARFRLTLAYLDVLGVELRGSDDAPPSVREGRRPGIVLREVSPPPLHLAVADALLFNPQKPQQELGQLPGQSIALWYDPKASAKNDEETRDVLGKTYAAVVGNPPFIAVSDALLRERYRAIYSRSAAGKYTLSVPFIERFFDLARPGGYVGMMNSNAFMKRSFGKRVIEDFLASVDLDGIVNTAGVPIPGPSIQTVLLFGRMQPPSGPEVEAVLHRRGDPQSADPEGGVVWQGIEKHWNEHGFEDEYITVTSLRRELLAKHPWSLGGGGAAELKELLEGRGEQRLSDVVESIGVGGMSNADDVFLADTGTLTRFGVDPTNIRPLVVGEEVRDWSHQGTLEVYFPYDEKLDLVTPTGRTLHFLWPFRTTLYARAVFGGGDYRSSGRTWFEWHQLTKDRYRTPLTIAYAEVATHNHFVLDRGGRVFKQTAPIIKLKPGATEEEHLALLAYLNSSTACFWFKQVGHQFGTSTADVSKEKGRPEANRFSFAAGSIEPLPLPRLEDPRLVLAAKNLQTGAEVVEELRARGGLEWLQADKRRRLVDLEEIIEAKKEALKQEQHRLDSAVYEAFGLVDDGEPQRWAAALEQPVNKRLWLGRQGVFGHSKRSTREMLVEVLETSVQERLEQRAKADAAIVPWTLLSGASDGWSDLDHLAGLLVDGGGLAALLLEVRRGLESVPYLAALRYADTGLEKRAAWERTWALQRKEDAGTLGDDERPIPVPPKYDPKDFRDASFFRLRGKLDVPKERFVSYPGCESDEDGEPVFGWAGWNHLQQAQALAALYEQRKKHEGWTAGPPSDDPAAPERKLTPMLAGLLELLPWLHQWHDEPDEAFGGLRMGQYFDEYLGGELRAWGVTREDLRAWRPTTRRAASARKAAAKKVAKKAAAKRAGRKAAARVDGPAGGQGEVAGTDRAGHDPTGGEP